MGSGLQAEGGTERGKGPCVCVGMRVGDAPWPCSVALTGLWAGSWRKVCFDGVRNEAVHIKAEAPSEG